jgi:hypothetical protein
VTPSPARVAATKHEFKFPLRLIEAQAGAGPGRSFKVYVTPWAKADDSVRVGATTRSCQCGS